MIHILHDESGDLGFNFENSRTTNYFSIALLITSDTRAVSNAVRNTFRTLRKTQVKRSGGILHCHYEDKQTRVRLLGQLAERDIKIATIKLDKRKLLFVDNQQTIYSSMVVSLLNRLYQDGHLNTSDEVKFIASQMATNKNHIKQFISVVSAGTENLSFTVEVSTPASEKGLQAIDFISWSLWRKYEFGETEYADIIADKVLCEYDYY
jgi:predicted membrane GTPase involved in stress response